VREGGDFQPSAWEDFGGVSVGAQSGTTGADQVQSNLVDPGLVAEDDYRTYGSYVLAVEDLENENIDAVVIDLPVAETFAANRDVEIAFIEETGEQFGFGLRQGESEFQSALNDGLATVRDDGTYSGSRTPGSDRSRMSDPGDARARGGRQPRRRGSAVGRAGPAAHRLRLAARRRGRGLGVRLQQRRLPRRRRPVDDWAHGRIDTPRVRRWLSGRRGRGVRRRPSNGSSARPGSCSAGHRSS